MAKSVLFVGCFDGLNRGALVCVWFGCFDGLLVCCFRMIEVGFLALFC
jgi:hypothetical protein